MSSPYLFNVFLDNLEIKQGSTPAVFKYVDDSAIDAPARKGGRDTSSGSVEEFMTWANCNSIKCNPTSVKNFSSKRKGTSHPILLHVIQ